MGAIPLPNPWLPASATTPRILEVSDAGDLRNAHSVAYEVTMRNKLRLLLRHGQYLIRIIPRLLPTRRGFEVASRCNLVVADACADLFPVLPLEVCCAGRDTVELSLAGFGEGGTNLFERIILCALVKRVQPAVLLEIGVFKGATTWHLLQNAPRNAKVYAIDLPEGVLPEGITDRGLAANKERPFLPASDHVRLMLVDTKKWNGVLPEKLQFAFIDGDHSYAGVKNDTEKVFANLDEEACVCWHDCFGRDYGYGTMKYLKELRRAGRGIFRFRGTHEISSLAVFMTEGLRRRLNFTVPG